MSHAAPEFLPHSARHNECRCCRITPTFIQPVPVGNVCGLVGAKSVPRWYSITVSGVTNGTCDFCNRANRTFLVEQGHGGSNCTWATREEEWSNLCVEEPEGSSLIPLARLEIQTAGRLRVFFGGGATGGSTGPGVYTLEPHPDDFMEWFEVPRSSTSPACEDWPASVIVIPSGG